MSQRNNIERSSWTKLPDDFELQTTAELAAPPGGTTAIIDLTPPALPALTKNRKILLIIGLVLAVFDLFILPVVFFYSLTYTTSLTHDMVGSLRRVNPEKTPRQWLTSRSLHRYNMPLLYDDVCTLHTSMR